MLRYWIQEDLDAGEMESVIDKSKVPPAKAVQTIQSGDIDATIIQESFATIIGQMMASANLPGQETFGEPPGHGAVREPASA